MFFLISPAIILLALFNETFAAFPCTAEQRITAAEQIPYAYGLTDLGASAAAFAAVPFADNCIVTMFVSFDRFPISTI